MQRIKFTEEEINQIIDLYVNQHISMKKIGEQFGVSKGVISRRLKEYNIEIRKGNHTYYADYDKFENIDSAEKAYWLGFIAADGCIFERETNGSIIINIHRKDKEHLEKFKKFMNSNVNIIDHIQTEGFSNNTPMSKIVFNSLKMVNDFKNKGIVPRKSLILQPPLIDEQYFLPFILGYFDGDGSIYKLSQNNRYEISFVGTKEMLTWICEVLHLTNIPLLKRNYDNKNNYHIKIGGTNIAYSILKQLYESSPVFLDRKYEIYLNLKNSRS